MAVYGQRGTISKIKIRLAGEKNSDTIMVFNWPQNILGINECFEAC
jgi:hypothetical protein